jgi:hypothetical protein
VGVSPNGNGGLAPVAYFDGQALVIKGAGGNTERLQRGKCIANHCIALIAELTTSNPETVGPTAQAFRVQLYQLKQWFLRLQL